MVENGRSNKGLILRFVAALLLLLLSGTGTASSTDDRPSTATAEATGFTGGDGDVVQNTPVVAAASTGASSSTIISSTTTTTVAESVTTASTTTVAVAPPVLLVGLSSSTSTCPYRTANYITHILPQQCLKTTWPGIANYTTHTGGVSAETVASATTTTPSSAVEASSGADKTETGPSISEKTEEASPPAGSSAVQQDGNLSESLGSPQPAAEAETDSPLDNSKFLSFEEWKKQNLENVGQSLESVGQGRSTGDGRRRPAEISNALDSFGDDGEIDLDFGGFDISSKTEQPASRWSSGQERKREETGEKNAKKTAPSRPRNKDAGKTCKERFNYASFDCAATILKTGTKCKSPSSVLVENKDSYMLNECSTENKFLIVELCDDILIDTIVLANFEFFSSMFRTFRISVSDRYPVKIDRWKELGTFEARNTREMQAFLIENPLIWARYLRVEFLTHYGSEFYCPVSLLRVHGTTMIEEFRNDAGKGEDDAQDDVAEPVASESPPEPVPVVQQEMSSSPIPVETEKPSQKSFVSPSTPSQSPIATEDLVPGGNHEQVSSSKGDGTSTSPSFTDPTSAAFIGPLLKGVTLDSESIISTAPATKSTSTRQISDLSQGSSSASLSSTTATTQTTIQSPDPSSKSISSSIVTSKVASSMPERKSSKNIAAPSPSNVAPSSKSHASSHEAVRSPPSSAHPPPPSPTTQESFFKSIHKRLQMLEANSTLSLQYIEEQSRILRDAFTTVEKRQMSKTENFLRHLNDTVMGELKGFRQQYDQLWQSTVIELETHREQYQREIMAISSRLTIVADELVFQKRMAVVQSTLLLLCLALFIFVRSGGGHLELPIVQQVFNKSHNMLRLQFDSPPESPSSKDNSPQRQGRGLRRHPRSRRDLLNGGHDTDAPFSSPFSSPSLPSKRINIKQQQSPQSPPTLGFSPPTPSPSPTDVGDETDARLLPGDGSPVNGPGNSVRSRGSGGSAIERVRHSQSGPATPRGTRDDPLEWVGETRRLESGSSSSSGGSSSNEDSEDPTGNHIRTRKTRGSEDNDVNGVEEGEDIDLAGARHERRPGLSLTDSGSEDDGTMMLLMD